MRKKTGPPRLPKAPYRITSMCMPEPNSGCWLWLGCTSSTGYGQLRADGRTRFAHRVSYEIFVGPIPAGMVIRHRCDNPLCVNPDHLQIGTMKDNTADMYRRGRNRHRPPTGESHHRARLTADDVRAIRADPRGPSELGRRYGVDPSTITDIRKGRTWKSVA